MAEHIAYELEMAAHAIICWWHDNDPLFGEVALMHVRSLIEFYVGRDVRPVTDIWPTDYVANWAPDKRRADKLRRDLQMIDRYLAHLSLVRAEPVLLDSGGVIALAWNSLCDVLALARRHMVDAAGEPGSAAFSGAMALVHQQLFGTTPQ